VVIKNKSSDTLLLIELPQTKYIFISIFFVAQTSKRPSKDSRMKIENDADPYMWFADCLGPEPQDWMKDVGLDWFDEELLGRPESPGTSAPVPRPTASENISDHHRYRGGYPSYTIESSAWLIQQHQRSADSGDDKDEDDSLPPPVLPPMIPGTRSFSDQLHRIRKPYALGSPPPITASGLLVRCFQFHHNIILSVYSYHDRYRNDAFAIMENTAFSFGSLNSIYLPMHLKHFFSNPLYTYL